MAPGPLSEMKVATRSDKEMARTFSDPILGVFSRDSLCSLQVY
jgi:hypothetical protein